MSIAARAARNFSGQMASLVISFADRIVLTGLLIRSWGPTVFSDWAILLAAAGLLAMSEFGFQVMLGNFLVRAEQRGRRRAFQRLVGIGIFFYLALALFLVLLVAALIFSLDLPAALELQSIAAPNAVFALLAGHQILRLLRIGVAQVFRGKGEVYQLMWFDVRALTAAVVLAGCAAALDGPPLVAALLYAGAEALIGTLWLVATVRRRFRDVRLLPLLPSRREMMVVVKGLPWYGWIGSVALISLHVPILIVSWLGLGGPLLITYVVQRTLVNFGKTLSNSVSVAIGIELADLGAGGDTAARDAGIRMIARFNVALAALLLTGLLTFGPSIIGIWTGRFELGSIPILVWLLLPVVLMAPAIPLQMLTLYGSRPKPQAAAAFIQMLVGIPLCAFAGAHFGVAGVAAGIGIGEALGAGVVLPAVAAGGLGVRYPRLLAECAALFLPAAAWSGAAGWLAGRAIATAQLGGLAVALALWAAVAAGPVLFFSLPPAMRRHLLEFLRAKAYGQAR